MGYEKNLKVATVVKKISKSNAIIAINAGHKFYVKMQENHISDLQVNDAIAFYEQDEKYEFLFNFKDKSNKEDVIKAINDYNWQPSHIDIKGHKHGTIRQVRYNKIIVEMDDPVSSPLRTLYKNVLGESVFNMLRDLGCGTRLTIKAFNFFGNRLVYSANIEHPHTNVDHHD